MATRKKTTQKKTVSKKTKVIKTSVKTTRAKKPANATEETGNRRGRVWSGAISFGLINIPVGVETAEQDKDLHFNQLDKRNLAHIKYKKINEKTGNEVPNDQIVKGFHHESGKYVVMSDEDFKRANPKATQTIDIHTFVKMDEIDPVYFERPYFLVPQKGGDKGYELLLEALVKSKKVAIATVVMRTKEYLTCVFPKGDFLFLEILRFSHTLKSAPSKHPVNANFKPQELAMAEQLVEGMTSKWKPEQYKDTYYADLKKHIEKRVKAGKLKDVEEVDEIDSAVAEENESEDLMTLLKASLSKKPAKAQNAKSVHHH
jgi:DNA end-binding protein Ku